jgi:hypothetical protein
VEGRDFSSRQTQNAWRLGNLSTPNDVQKLPMASHAKTA